MAGLRSVLALRRAAPLARAAHLPAPIAAVPIGFDIDRFRSLSSATTPATTPAQGGSWQQRMKRFWKDAETVSDAAIDLEGKLNQKAAKLGKLWDPRVDDGNSILAFCVCCDEVHKLKPIEDKWTNSTISGQGTLNRELATGAFQMGGLAGFPIDGTAALGAFMSHVPDDGVGVLVYGPHISVSDDGVAVLDRFSCSTKKGKPSTCGSAVGALDSVMRGVSPGPEETQQLKVFHALLKAAPWEAPIDTTDRDRMYAKVVRVLYEEIHERVDWICSSYAAQAEGPFDLCTYGGIIINTPLDQADYFVHKAFNHYSRPPPKCPPSGSDSADSGHPKESASE